MGPYKRSAGLALRVIPIACVAVSGMCATACTSLATQSVTKKLNFTVIDSPEFDACMDQFIVDELAICPTGASKSALMSPNVTPTRATATQPLTTQRPAFTLSNPKDPEESRIVAAANLAVAVLNHDVQKSLNETFNFARRTSTADAYQALDISDKVEVSKAPTKAKLTLRLSQIQDYIEKIENATLAGGWDALETMEERESSTRNQLTLEAFATLANDAKAQFIVGEDKLRRAQYLASYVRAYFRQGKFIQATVDLTQLRSKVAKSLKETIPGLAIPNQTDPYEYLASTLFTSLGVDKTTVNVGSILDTAFVSRSGHQFQFPSVQATFDVGTGEKQITHIDYMEVGADLIRVVLHAIYDADYGVPAVGNATGTSDEKIDAKWRLVKNSEKKVSAEEFGEIESIAGQVEGISAAAFGRLIRGASIVALNNEALATALETTLGAAVRKYSEKVMWCLYACQPKDEPNRSIQAYSPILQNDVSSAGQPKTLSLELTVKR